MDLKLDRIYRHFGVLKKRPFGKSKTHARIQTTLKKLLHPDKVWIEHSFPEIKRIADVVWPEKKLIFEIQCSFITAEEIKRRNADYSKLGFTVIWLLHDRIFNRLRLTSAEKSLYFHTHYFVKKGAFGKLFFYDQYAQVSFKKRVRRSPKLEVDLRRPSFNSMQFSSQFPQERKQWKVVFKGDLYSQQNKPLFISKRSFIKQLLSSIYVTILEKTTD